MEEGEGSMVGNCARGLGLLITEFISCGESVCVCVCVCVWGRE